MQGGDVYAVGDLLSRLPLLSLPSLFALHRRELLLEESPTRGAYPTVIQRHMLLFVLGILLDRG